MSFLRLPVLPALLLGLTGLIATPARSTVVISEFMASNASGITDDFGQNSDWIELTNTGAVTVNCPRGWA